MIEYERLCAAQKHPLWKQEKKAAQPRHNRGIMGPSCGLASQRMEGRCNGIGSRETLCA